MVLVPGGSAGETEAANRGENRQEPHFARSSARVALTQAERTGAIRAGWNDAAWGRPWCSMPDGLAHWYALGYSGGLVFRRRTLDRR